MKRESRQNFKEELKEFFKGVKVVFLDLRGTIIDYPDPFQEFGDEEAEKIGVDKDILNEILEEYKKIIFKKDEKGEYLYNEADLENVIKGVLDSREIKNIDPKEVLEKIYKVRFSNKKSLKEGVIDFIKALKLINKDVKICILSNFPFPKEYIKKDLKECKIDSYFDEIITSLEIGKIKPHSEIFNKALEKVGLTPEDKNKVLLVGDEVNTDLMGGLNVGIKVLLLSNEEVKLDKDFPEYNWKRISNYPELFSKS